MTHSAIVSFYLGTSPDIRGRHLEDIWSWSDDQLEAIHDYVQWLFPLTAKSRFNPNAPRLTPTDIQTFRTTEALKQRLHTSFQRLLQFYGLEWQEPDGAIVIQPAANFLHRKREWLQPGNHNHLRITRILTSLRVLGLDDDAQAFFRCLEQIYEREPEAIEPRSYEFWRSAVSQPIA